LTINAASTTLRI